MNYSKVTVCLDDMVSDVPAQKLLRAYGASAFLEHLSAREVVQHFDRDTLLDAIGEDAIRDYLATPAIKEVV